MAESGVGFAPLVQTVERKKRLRYAACVANGYKVPAVTAVNLLAPINH